MRHVTKLLFALLLVVLAGCASTVTPAPTVVPMAPVAIPQPTPTNLQDLNIEVVNADKIKEVSDRFTAKPDTVIYVLDQQNLEILVGNLEELRRFILEQKLTIKFLGDVLQSREAKTTETSPKQ